MHFSTGVLAKAKKETYHLLTRDGQCQLSYDEVFGTPDPSLPAKQFRCEKTGRVLYTQPARSHGLIDLGLADWVDKKRNLLRLLRQVPIRTLSMRHMGFPEIPYRFARGLALAQIIGHL